MKYFIILLIFITRSEAQEEMKKSKVSDFQIYTKYGLGFDLPPTNFKGKNFFEIIKEIEHNKNYIASKTTLFKGIVFDASIRQNDPHLLKVLDINYSVKLDFLTMLKSITDLYQLSYDLEQGRILISKSQQSSKIFIITPQISLVFEGPLSKDNLSLKLKKLCSVRGNLIIETNPSTSVLVIKGCLNDIKRVESLFYLIETSEQFRKWIKKQKANSINEPDK